MSDSTRIINLSDLSEEEQSLELLLRVEKRGRIVLVHGCFDVLHYGHIEYFKSAKKFGDLLYVSVTSDRYVNKGPGRPVFSADVRIQMLKELGVVDEVLLSDAPTAVETIKRIRPSFYVKGPDYRDVTTPDMLAEIAAVEEVGGKFVCTDDATYSSSALANRFFVTWSDEQQKAIDRVKALGGMDAIEKALSRIQEDVYCVVMGECIKDVYRFVKPQGVSSKSPTISAQWLREEEYRGGAWAITEHIRGFCHVTQFESGTVHQKARYISEDNGQRLFEITNIEKEKPLSGLMPFGNLYLIADFGHGMITNFRINEFVALNVQTNSSNFGFNPFTRHKNFDFLVVDLRELQLAYQDRETDVYTLSRRAHVEYGDLAVTLGPNGSIFWKDGKAYHCPAFCDKVVDAIGAGDAFFAITSLLVKTKADPDLVGFLGNVFAGLKAKIIGNKTCVTKESLLRTCAAILR